MKLKNLLLSGAAMAATALVAAPASALSVGCLGTGCGGGLNDYVSPHLGNLKIEGYMGANLYLVGGSANVHVDVFGAEAGWANSFNYGAGSYSHPGGTVFGAGVNTLAQWDVAQGVGLMSFNFGVNGGTLLNGNNPDSLLATPNFFAAFYDPVAYLPGLPDFNVDGIVAGGGQYVWLFLDDGGGGPDDNHDDLVVRLTLTGDGRIVPEPATLGLLGLGLVGLGALRRRKTA